LFGDQGYAATSLRHIIAEAGSIWRLSTTTMGPRKRFWMKWLCGRRGVNEARLALLDRYEAEARGGPLAVEVDVKHAHVRQPEQAFGAAHGFREAGGRGDVEAGGQQMAGVQAVADGEMVRRPARSRMECQLLEAAAEVEPRRRYFEQHGEPRGMNRRGGRAPIPTDAAMDWRGSRGRRRAG